MTTANIEVRSITEVGIVISLQISQWGGRKKLRSEDLGDNINLPPDTLASLGSKKICDPADLKIFNTLKARAETLLKKTGINNLVGKSCYIVPLAKAEDVVRELRAIRADFDQAKDKFFANYDLRLEEWLAANSEWRSIIENSLLSKNEVRHKIGFNWIAFSFTETAIPGLNSELDNKLSGLVGRLFFEISQVAKDSYEKSFDKKDTVGRKAMGPLKTLRDKLDGFSIVSPLVLPIVEDIDQVLAAVPDNGQPISGFPLLGLQGILSLLKDPKAAHDYAERKLAGMAGDDPFGSWQADNGFTMIPAPATAVPVDAVTPEPKLPQQNDLPLLLEGEQAGPVTAVEEMSVVAVETAPEVIEQEVLPQVQELEPVEVVAVVEVETEIEADTEITVDVEVGVDPVYEEEHQEVMPLVLDSEEAERFQLDFADDEDGTSNLDLEPKFAAFDAAEFDFAGADEEGGVAFFDDESIADLGIDIPKFELRWE